MPNDALAVAIAERDAAWERYAKYKAEPTLRSLAFYNNYLRSLADLRAICPHDRVEDRGYGGMMVCVLCGETMQ